MPEYIVQKGDTLSGIAQKVGLGSNWQALGYGGDPRTLQIGTKLAWGAPAPENNAPAPTPVAPTGNVLEPYIDAATKQVSPGYDAAETATQAAADKTKDTYGKLADQQLAREPLVRQTYANLSKEFGASQIRETNVASRIGEQNIGGARANVAASGVEAGQGAFAAPITAQQDKLINDVASIADKYNLKQETLTSEMNSSIQDLYDKADQYRITGDTEYSKAMVDIAKLKIDEKKDILSLAQQMFGDDEEVKKFKYQVEQDQKQYDLEVRKFNESIRQFNVSQANSKSDAGAKEAASAAKNYKYEPQKNADGDITGFDFYDDRGVPTAPFEYFAAKGNGVIDINDMKKVFQSSSNQGDKDIATAISLMQRQGLSNASIGNAIASKYPHLKG